MSNLPMRGRDSVRRRSIFAWAMRRNCPLPTVASTLRIMALVISFVPDPNKAAAEIARMSRRGGWVATVMWDIPGGGTPTDPIYVSLESMGMTFVRPANPVVSRREAMEDLWEKAGLESIDTRVMRIPVVYSDFDEFWDSNTVLIGPQGKLIAGMSASAREQLRAELRDRLPFIRKRCKGPSTRSSTLT